MFKFPTPPDRDNSQILIGCLGPESRKGGGGSGGGGGGADASHWLAHYSNTGSILLSKVKGFVNTWGNPSFCSMRSQKLANDVTCIELFFLQQKKIAQGGHKLRGKPTMRTLLFWQSLT